MEEDNKFNNNNDEIPYDCINKVYTSNIYTFKQIQWNFPNDIQNKIKNEFNNNNDNFIKENTSLLFFKNNNNNKDKIINTIVHSKCICKNYKDINCKSIYCKFNYTKFNKNLNEIRFKDGLEIFDIPSTYLNNIEKRLKKKQQKNLEKN